FNRCESVINAKKKKHYAVQRRDLQMVHMSKQEAMLEVKNMLKRVDELLGFYSSDCNECYSVCRFYGSLLTAVCLLSVLNSTLFLWNRNFCRLFSFSFNMLDIPCDPDHSNLLEHTPTPTIDLSPCNTEEAQEVEPDDEFKDAIEDMSSGVPEFDTVSDNGLLSRNEPIRSKVSKLTEKLARNCFQCNSAFSVLKKRRNCSNSGVSFGSRCCSYKVFKSSMEATAQRETVFVCSMCNTSLKTK
uniref:Zinc finger, FYVE domain containing 27 n=1 Tax=Cyprinus carpio carpio TaxID=630221 RepID=A0A8C1CAK4_CYPCA